MSYCIIISTVSSMEEGKKIAQALVKNKMAACVNIIPGITSVYSWKNEIWEDSEHVLFIKTRAELFENVQNYIKENHSYELPEVIMLPIEAGLESYLSWIKDNTSV